MRNMQSADVGMIKTYTERYLQYCADLNECTEKNDVRRNNAAMKQLGKLFQQIKAEPDKSFLLEPLKNKNDRTKALAAAHCLGLGVYIKETKEVLSGIANNKDNPILAFEAQATLDVWQQQGYLKF